MTPITITGKKTETYTVEVPPDELFRTLRNFICRNHSIPAESYVKDDKVYYNVEYGGHHTWSEAKFIDDASDVVELVKSLNLIQNHIKNIQLNPRD